MPYANNLDIVRPNDSCRPLSTCWAERFALWRRGRTCDLLDETNVLATSQCIADAVHRTLSRWLDSNHAMSLVFCHVFFAVLDMMRASVMRPIKAIVVRAFKSVFPHAGTDWICCALEITLKQVVAIAPIADTAR